MPFIRLRLERSGSLVLEDHVEVKVKDPWGKWIVGEAYFGNDYLPLLKKLEELPKRKEGYAVISFKEKPMIQAPLRLYLKYFSSPKPNGYGLFAGLTNAVVVISKGQAMDMESESRVEVTEKEYVKMILKEIAELFAVSAEIGGLLADIDNQRISNLKDYGMNLGIAFQMTIYWDLLLTRRNLVSRFTVTSGRERRLYIKKVTLGVLIEDATTHHFAEDVPPQRAVLVAHRRGKKLRLLFFVLKDQPKGLHLGLIFRACLDEIKVQNLAVLKDGPEKWT